MRASSLSLGIAAIALSAITAGSALAAPPYQFYAVYKSNDGADELSVPLEDGRIVPDTGDEWTLNRITIEFKAAGLGTTSLAVFRNFSVGMSPSDPKVNPISVPAQEINPSKVTTLLDWDGGVLPGNRTAEMTFDVRGKFSREFLCAAELLYREEKGKKREAETTSAVKEEKGKKADAEKPADASKEEGKKAEIAVFKDVPPAKAIEDDGFELLYSFCDPKAIKWDEAAKKDKYLFYKKDVSADELRNLHKDRLSHLLVNSGVLKKFNTPYQQATVAADAPGQPENVFIADKRSFTVVRTGKLFAIEERAFDRTGDVQTLIDQDSRLLIRAAVTPDGVCPNIRAAEFVYQLEVAKEEPKKLPIQFRETCSAELNVAFKDYLGKHVTFRISYKLDDKRTITVYKTEFDVANLGVITTFPGATEIAAFVTKPAPNDIESASSVPVSWAVPLGGSRTGMYAAVTLPWKLSYNSRKAPNLAKYLSGYAHVTGVFGLESNNMGFTYNLGVGVSIAQFLNVAWGIEPQTSQNYLLLGVSVPDIYKLVFGR